MSLYSSYFFILANIVSIDCLVSINYLLYYYFYPLYLFTY